MEEQPDDQYVESDKEEAREEIEESEAPAEDGGQAVAPKAAPVCKPVKKDLKEKVQCECGRWMSQHTYKYQHKCKAKSVAEVREEAAAPAEQDSDVLLMETGRILVDAMTLRPDTGIARRGTPGAY